MLIRTGVDIIEVDRIQEAIENQGKAFLRKGKLTFAVILVK